MKFLRLVFSYRTPLVAAPDSFLVNNAKFLRTAILKNICEAQKTGPAKWRVTVSGELQFTTSYLESSRFLDSHTT